MSLAIHNLNPLLKELNDALLLEDAAPVDWIVCGGTALALQGIGTRSTRDVDVLGNWMPQELQIVAIGIFPPAVERAIARVAEAHSELLEIGSRWVNLGPQEIVKCGLPERFAERLTAMRIGDRLTLHLLGRIDLIALKLYAAADDMGSRQQIHLDDLRLFEPTAEEINRAIHWVQRMPDPHHRIRPSLRNIVKELGHEDLAYYI
ncbi:MAG: hypothetical protein RL692_1252 [Planctomycetota bacterium]|jgi:hypothetical protein